MPYGIILFNMLDKPTIVDVFIEVRLFTKIERYGILQLKGKGVWKDSDAFLF